jgi:D-sedoheptulose 7-phosphate isomerase
MSQRDRIRGHFAASIETQQSAATQLVEPISRAGQVILDALLNGRKTMSCGNGRAAASAQHFSANMLNRFERDRPALPAIALNADTAALTAIARDFDHSQVFAKQIRALGQSGDVLLAINTGGPSGNIGAAIEAAHDRDCLVIALTGEADEALAGLLAERDVEIRAPSRSTARCHEIHLLAIHCLCDLIDAQLLGE